MTIHLPLLNSNFKIISSLALLLCATSCERSKSIEDQDPASDSLTTTDVIIIGAGAAGLAAANKLKENGLSYQILEGTDHYGGRTQKDDDFADFPIDLGGEWIHTDKSILTDMLGQSGQEPDVETILYQPMDIYYLNGTSYDKISESELRVYYSMFVEYKFKNTTWYDYINDNFAQEVQDNIVYNATVTTIDYTEDLVVVTTDNEKQYTAENVIVTVSVGVLQSEAITFIPELSEEKISAIDSVEFLPGFKLFMKFSDPFYPDVISCETPHGEKTYYDAAYNKDAEDHVFALIATGSSAQEYYQLANEEAIVEQVLSELDALYDGTATTSYTGEYILKDWGQQVHTLGTWTSNQTDASTHTLLTRSLEDRVHFAGATFKVSDPLYMRGSVHGAILSGYGAAEIIIENQ